MIVLVNIARLRQLAGIRFWLFFSARSMAALIAPTAAWLAAMRLAEYSQAGGIGGLAFLLAAVWTVLLLSIGALLWSLRAQRLRCRVCLRRLRMPVSRGAWSSLIMDSPAIEYICPLGHGRLSVAGSQDLRSPQWIPY